MRATSFKSIRSTFLMNCAALLVASLVSANAGGLPKIVPAEKAAACKFIASVEGSSGTSKKSNWQDVAKNAALQQAANLLATHVVWENVIEANAGNGLAIGKAYECDP